MRQFLFYRILFKPDIVSGTNARSSNTPAINFAAEDFVIKSKCIPDQIVVASCGRTYTPPVALASSVIKL